MPNSESVGKKIVEALKKQADNMDLSETNNDLFDINENVAVENNTDDIFDTKNDDILSDNVISSVQTKSAGFFDETETETDPFFAEPVSNVQSAESTPDRFEMPANIAVLKKLISQLPSGVSRHTGAQIIKQTMEALGISMKSVLQDAQQVQENLKVSARECQASIQEYKKQILALEKQSQSYQKQYSALNDLISLFIQTTK